MDGVPVFVSLTTISSRLAFLDEVIESLNAQTLRAEKIVLNVSRDSFALDEGISFEDLPTATRKLAVQGRVEVYFTRNTGPYRKLLPLLRRMQGEDCLIASADDDVIYPPRWLEGLRDAFVEHRCVVAYRCRAMRIKDGTFAPYNTWPVFFFGKEPDYTDFRDEARQLLICPTGRGGIMYHPSFFPALDLVERLRTLAPMQDDLAFRFATLVQGIPVCPLHFGNAGSPSWEFASSRARGPSLFADHNGSGGNDTSLARIVDYCTQAGILRVQDYCVVPQIGIGGGISVQDASQIIRKSQALVEEGASEQAVELLQQALEAQPQDLKLLAHAGNLLMRTGRHADAEVRFQQAIELAPKQAGLRNGLSHALASQGHTQAAITAITGAIDLEPNHADYLAHLGNLLIRAAKYAKAEEPLRKAVGLAAQVPRYHFALSVALERQYRVPEAIEPVRSAVDLEPANLVYRKRLVDLLALSGSIDEAEQQLRAAVELTGGDPAIEKQIDELVAWRAAQTRYEQRKHEDRASGRARIGRVQRTKAAVCVIVKNEADSLLEWMAFHQCIGFDTFIVVDDGSTDDTPNIVRHFAANADVRLSSYREQRDRQASAYQRLCQQYRDEFDWIAFIDADEFIVPVQDQRIHQLLERAGDHSAIALPWLIFGSSGHRQKPRDLMIEAYRRRAPDQFGPNRHVKSIVRPAQVRSALNAHAFDVDGAYCGPDGSPLLWASPGILRTVPDHGSWRIHHYFTRSEAHWRERMQRGQLSRIKRTIETFHEYDRNEIVDETALRFLAPLSRTIEARQREVAFS